MKIIRISALWKKANKKDWINARQIMELEDPEEIKLILEIIKDLQSGKPVMTSEEVASRGAKEVPISETVTAPISVQPQKQPSKSKGLSRPKAFQPSK